MSSFTATWIALSLVLAAYAEESLWAGILAVPPGQAEAARSTGLNWWQTMGWVVLPQALRVAVPPLTNRVLSITKNTALGSVVALNEILNAAQSASSKRRQPDAADRGCAGLRGAVPAAGDRLALVRGLVGAQALSTTTWTQ